MRDFSSWLTYLTVAVLALAIVLLSIKTRCTVFKKGFWQPGEGHPKTMNETPVAFFLSLIIWSVVCVYSFFAFVNYNVVLNLPIAKLQTVSGVVTDSRANCIGREECVTVYLTPWCPHCIKSVDFLNSVQRELAHHPNIAMQIIIGNDGRERLVEMANKFEFPALIDVDDAFKKAAGISSFPLTIVSDGEYFILRNFSAFQHIGQSDQQRFDYFNKEFLKLKSLN